ncbi:hypothetical protein WDV91_02325 [Curtobacterium flaccumfaciens pv. flaccumfaciens]
MPLVYGVAVLTPVGQKAEDAALGGVRESDLFSSDTALNVISVPVILLLVVVIVAVAFARRRLSVGLGAGGRGARVGGHLDARQAYRRAP